MTETDDLQLAQLFTRGDVASFDDLRSAGYTEAAIRLLVRDDALNRVGHGIYSLGSAWTTSGRAGWADRAGRAAGWADRAGRAAGRIQAVSARRRAKGMVSGIAVGPSAAQLWDADLLHIPSLVHLAVSERYARNTEDGVQVHGFALRPDEVTEIDDVLVTTRERTLLDCAAMLPREAAIVVVDSLLRGGADRELARELFHRHRRVGAANIRWALGFGNGLSESAGESRARYAFHLLGFPPPELQVPLYTRRGLVRLDFLWRKYRLVCAFDGRIKYGKYSDGDPQNVAWEERQRELAIIDTEREMFRLIWNELADLALINRRFHEAKDRAIRRFGVPA